LVSKHRRERFAREKDKYDRIAERQDELSVDYHDSTITGELPSAFCNKRKADVQEQHQVFAQPTLLDQEGNEDFNHIQVCFSSTTALTVR
jgi:hypothetical protein